MGDLGTGDATPGGLRFAVLVSPAAGPRPGADAKRDQEQQPFLDDLAQHNALGRSLGHRINEGPNIDKAQETGTECHEARYKAEQEQRRRSRNHPVFLISANASSSVSKIDRYFDTRIVLSTPTITGQMWHR